MPVILFVSRWSS